MARRWEQLVIINEWHNVDDTIGIRHKRIIRKLIVNIIIIFIFFLLVFKFLLA